jgi:hypothetical protein
MSANELQQAEQVSRELELELLEQYHSLVRRAAQHRERAEVLSRLAEQAAAQASTDERLVHELAGALGIACQLRIEQLDRSLRGQRLQEIAVEILAARLEPGEPVHYKKWFAWIEEAGFTIMGKDPLATFLGQIARSPRVISAGRRSGIYMLRAAA